MLGVVFCAMTILGVVFSLVILRADPRRWDNRFFAAMGMLDSVMTGYRGIALLEGRPIDDPSTVPVCAALAFPLGWLAVEFAYSFPFNRPAPARLRVPIALATIVSVFLVLTPSTREVAIRLEPYIYSLPMCTLMVVLLARNLRRAPGDRVALGFVAGAFLFRWASAIATYGIVRSFVPDALPAFMSFDATFAVLLGDLLITIAVLRSQLFSMRGFAATVVVLTGSAALVLALAAVAIEAALHAATSPGALRALLLLATLIPVLVIGAGMRLRGRIERAVAQNLDPRRALRESVLERAQATRDPDPIATLRVARDALSEITGGGRVDYLGAPRVTMPAGHVLGPELAPDLARRIGTASELLRVHAPELPYDLVVAVRSGEKLHGAIAIEGGRVDRDTVLATHALADRLALKLDAYALFLELEAARRLATLGSFAAAIAHDIRTPLTSVKMNVQILRGKAKSASIAPEDDLEYFDIALEELDRLDASITELLDFAKPARIASAALDLRALASDVARATASTLRAKKLSLEMMSRGQEEALRDLPLRGDAQRLRQVLENLVTNAAAASKDGGSIAIDARRAEDGRVAIAVSDEGQGIAAKDLPHIFEPFFTTRPDGTGLGLAICDKLVRAHGGEIRVHTREGEGTTFTIVLPVDTDATSSAGSEGGDERADETGKERSVSDALPTAARA